MAGVDTRNTRDDPDDPRTTVLSDVCHPGGSDWLRSALCTRPTGARARAPPENDDSPSVAGCLEVVAGSVRGTAGKSPPSSGGWRQAEEEMDIAYERERRRMVRAPQQVTSQGRRRFWTGGYFGATSNSKGRYLLMIVGVGGLTSVEWIVN